ncbi:hypothetical protein [Sediminibacterium sp. TEGAF015]|uniref:hypothetical protein n=1 Tax=Sediminibacterium sp. TEGAF015 TaxID=575378 RepID=UPI00220C3AD6|nr:hypothetical protein [Sediminibacterium sp. TEGAF015]BDQ10908.1 hypothetical protein TEGAF0_01250 [Sediminibacterium sp. TEGAF015]
MNKCVLIIAIVMGISLSGFAQMDNREAEGPVGFDRSRIFIGSSLNLGISNRFFNVGVNPTIGYSLNNWVDVGVAMNFNYASQNASVFNSYKYKNFNYGGGAFLRFWPVSFLHLQIQPEYNWISSSRTDPVSGQTTRLQLQAPSMLAGIGYGSREIGRQLSYFTIMIDLNQAVNSPYRDGIAGDPQPIFRGGLGFYLNSKKK